LIFDIFPEKHAIFERKPENSEFLLLLCEISKINLNAIREYDEVNLKTTINQKVPGPLILGDVKLRSGTPLGLEIDQLNSQSITRLIKTSPELMYASVIGSENKDDWYFQFPLVYLIKRGPPWIDLFPLIVSFGIDINQSHCKDARPLNAHSYFSESLFIDKMIPDETLTGLNIFIQNGLMNFSIYPSVGFRSSIIMVLILQYRSENRKKLELETMLKTLISLGFGRGPAEFESDRHLMQEREYYRNARSYFTKNPIRIQMVLNIIDFFDSYRYSLKERCRNTLRLSIGGIKFKERVHRLPLPIMLKNFLILQD